MSIKRFPNGSTDPLGVEPLATWLESVKEGTFLEDATLTVEDIYVSGDYYINELLINIGNDTARIRASKMSYSGTIEFGVALLNPYTPGCELIYRHEGSGSGLCAIQNAWLCKNGLIVSTFWTGGRASAAENGAGTTLLITKDLDDNLVLAYTDPYLGQTSGGQPVLPNQFYTLTRSQSKLLYKPEPWTPLNRFYTNIHAVSVINPSGEPVALRDFLVSSVTQTPTANYSTVYYSFINGTAYITNGIWYVKDE